MVCRPVASLAELFWWPCEKETGKSAQEYVQQKTMNTAKEMLVQTSKSISEIAYRLGYQYPQYFSRAFKGCSIN